MYDMKALYQAGSVEEAVALRLEHPEAQIIAGGSDVLVQMREGKRAYKLILDSDSEEFGGCGRQRPQSYKAVEAECDGRPYSIAYPLEPYGVAVFRY